MRKEMKITKVYYLQFWQWLVFIEIQTYQYSDIISYLLK